MAIWAWIVIIIAVLVVAGLIALMERRRRTARLRDRFGPEYDRTLESRDNQRAAEAELRGRQRHRAKLDIKPLPEASRIRYIEEWRVVQERFVDQPTEAVSSADRLLHGVMAERGYPVGDFAAQSDLISVDHPDVVENYRAAHGIFERADSGSVGTEELREALLRYRSLFGELLRPDQDGTAPDNTPRADTDRQSAPADDMTDIPDGQDIRETDAGQDIRETRDGEDFRETEDGQDLQAGAVPAQRMTTPDPVTSEADNDAR